MKGYKQINAKRANRLYHKLAKQYESDSSMTYQVQNSRVFLILRSRESLTDNICHINQLTPISKRLHFKFVYLILIGQSFMCYTQIDTLYET